MFYIGEPNWNRTWLRIEFDPFGDACALQDRYARKAMDSDSEYLWELEEMHGADSPVVQEFADSHQWWTYNDPVYLGPYMEGQPEDGWFVFQGPRVQIQGPRASREFNREHGWDRTLTVPDWMDF